LPLSTHAQSSNLGNWLIYFGNKQIDNKWNLHHEVQYRNYNALGDLEQLLLRTGVGHTFNNQNNLLLGYGFIRSENYRNNSDTQDIVNEHRIYQQFIIKQRSKSYSLQHRYRFEQRFVESEFKLRFRYFLALNLSLSSKGLSEKTPYISVYNELFINGQDNAFDRNRLYGGIGYLFNSKVKTEIGYMNQFFQNASRDQINLIVFYNF
jgi:hypothetical protein